MAKLSEVVAKVRGQLERVPARLQGQPSVVAQLSQQHAEVDALMQRLLNASANSLREPANDNPAGALYASVRSKLLQLIDVQEHGLYADLSWDELRPLLVRARERHRQLREVLVRLESPSGDRVAWDEELRQLSLIFRQHVKEQREELFPHLQHAPLERPEQRPARDRAPSDGR